MSRASNAVGAERKLLRWVQRHERRLIVAWLAACVAVLAFIGLWGIATNGAEQAVEAYDTRWVRELDDVARWIDAKDYERAQTRLEELDRDCPAVFVKHRFDKERERLLSMLATCYVELDHKKKALATLEQLVAFDPKNFANHFQLAETYRRFGDTDGERAAYAQVLAIHPTHLPSVEANIHSFFYPGQYAPVVEAYQRYLDAWLLARIRVRFGAHVVELDVPVDGRAHVVEAPLDLPAGWSGDVRVETRGYSAHIEPFEITAPLRVGLAEEHAVQTIRPAADEVLAGAADSHVDCGAVTLAAGAARLRVQITLFKALREAMWIEVTKSYRNRLKFDELRDAEQRSRLGGCPEAGTLFED